MRKSGLHKQISSIFDGVPVPTSNNLHQDADSTSVLRPSDAENGQAAVSEQTTETAPVTAKSSLVKRLSADPSECASAPSIQVERPMPMPKSAIAKCKSGPGVFAGLKKTLFGSSAKSLDPHQKKMAMMVGVLAAVFAVVMYISLGGVGKSTVNTKKDNSEENGHSSATVIRPEDWKSPKPLSAELRNATSPVTQTSSVEPTGTENTDTNPSELVVSGIVFSKNKPTAIINNQIFHEGETINGVRIVKITKEAVEFLDQENRWSQKVRR